MKPSSLVVPAEAAAAAAAAAETAAATELGTLYEPWLELMAEWIDAAGAHDKS